MSIWDEHLEETEVANTLESEILRVLDPIFDECIENGFNLESYYYLVSTVSARQILKYILKEKGRTEKEKK